MRARYILLVLALLNTINAAPAADLVPELMGSGPNGTDTLDYTLYSGYVNHTDSSKRIHYMMVYSENNWKTDPLIIWFNGGPGCSSMLAFMQENGPYEMPSGEYNWTKSDYSWNREASVLYIDQPAGVGFSYCNATQDVCSFDDNSAAADNVKTIIGWFELFPEFKQHELYIAGESYAGIYVPYLANGLHVWNQQHQRDPTVHKPNLKGFMVGNGCTNWNVDTAPAQVDTYYWHSLVSQDWYNNYTTNTCDFGQFATNQTDVCNELADEFESSTQDVDVYDIFGTCYGASSNGTANEYKHSRSDIGFAKVGDKLKPYRKAVTAADYTPWVKNRYRDGPQPNDDEIPCTFADGILQFLNNPTVRDQLHIPDDVQAFELCSSTLEYDILAIGSQWIWESLKGKYRMLKYSGDVDGSVPTKGTLRWINGLNRPVVEDWRPFFVDNSAGQGEIGGSIKEWEDLTLGIVHGAGHMVPQFKPAAAYHLIFNWLKQTPI